MKFSVCLQRFFARSRAEIALCLLLPFSSTLLAQEVGLPVLSPAALAIGTKTKVLISANVQVENLILNSVNVQRIDPAGRATVIGSLADNGSGGDITAGDGIYSGTFDLEEFSAGHRGIRVSAAIRGSVRRVMSPVFNLAVLPVGAPLNGIVPNLSNTSVDPRTGAKIVADMVIACFRPTVDYGQVLAISASVSATVVGRFSDIGNCVQLRLPPGSNGASVANAISILEVNPNVASVGPDKFRGLAESCTLPTCTSNIPGYSKQLQLPLAHDVFSRGAGVRIGIVDTGVYVDPIVAINLGTFPPWQIGPDFTVPGAPLPLPGTAVDDQGHGTNVTTILKATAPESTLYINKWFSGARLGTVATSILAYQDMKAAGVQIVNISTAGEGADVHEAMAIDALIKSKVIVVAAAGNLTLTTPPQQPEYPGGYPGVFTVGSVSDGDVISAFSDRGSHVEIAAPGQNVFGYGAFGAFVPMNGTSQATPYVSGLIALVKSKYPKIDPIAQIIRTALPIPESIGQDQCALGPGPLCNQNLGAGRIAPLAALGAMRVIRNTAINAGVTQLTEITISPTPVPAFRTTIQTSGQSQGCQNPNAKAVPCLVDIPFDFSTLPNGNHTITLRTLESGSVSSSVRLSSSRQDFLLFRFKQVRALF